MSNPPVTPTPSRKRKNISNRCHSEDSDDPPKWSKERQRSLKELTAEIRGAFPTPSAEQMQMHAVTQAESIKVHLATERALIIIQRAPPLSKGSWCHAECCEIGQIAPGDYRFALQPGYHNSPDVPDFFHIECLERMLDLTSIEILPRVRPEVQYHPDGHNLLDEGALIAALTWLQNYQEENVRRWAEVVCNATCAEDLETPKKLVETGMGSDSGLQKVNSAKRLKTTVTASDKKSLVVMLKLRGSNQAPGPNHSTIPGVMDSFQKSSEDIIDISEDECSLGDALKAWEKQRAEILLYRENGMKHPDDDLIEVKMKAGVIYSRAMRNIWIQKV